MPRLLANSEYTLPDSHVQSIREVAQENNSVRFFMEESPQGAGGEGLLREEFDPHVRGQTLQGILPVLLRGGRCGGCWEESVSGSDAGAAARTALPAGDRNQYDGDPASLLPVRHTCGRRGRAYVKKDLFEEINRARLRAQLG